MISLGSFRIWGEIGIPLVARQVYDSVRIWPYFAQSTANIWRLYNHFFFPFFFLHMHSRATFSRDVLQPQFLLDQNSVRLSRVVFRSLRVHLTAQTSWIKGTKLPFIRSQFSGKEDLTSPSLKWHFLSTEFSTLPTLPAVPAKIQGTWHPRGPRSRPQTVPQL